ncbi:MAG TPA: flagellar hook basal-body protein [Pirellulaceae bacterium]|nr:flagellar hook basal-body protein [Pirellulaceae bacterium]
MINGLYSSASALDVLAQQQEAIASNLAHLNTPGHRRMIFAFKQATSGGESTRVQPGTRVDIKTADFSPGKMQQTGRNLDIALRGDGFFVYQGAGGPIYSRNGVLILDPQTKQLVNGDGFPLLDDSNSPLALDSELTDLAVAFDGTLTNNGQQIGKIAVVTFDNVRLLESENQTYFRAGQATPSPATEFSIVQGFRELSNASPITELIALIAGSRSFEASQRAIRMIADSLQEQTRS